MAELDYRKIGAMILLGIILCGLVYSFRGLLGFTWIHVSQIYVEPRVGEDQYEDLYGSIHA